MSSKIGARARCAVLCLSLGFPIQPLVAQSAGGVITFDIPAQPLDRAVTELARQSGFAIGGDAALLRGKQAPALRGKYTPQDALRALLAGSGVEAVPQPDGGYTLAKEAVMDGVTTLPTVTVVGAADNYGRLPETTATVGATTTATRLPIDTREIPQSIGVISEQLIEETAARSAADVAPFVSGVSNSQPFFGFGSNLVVRGFEIGSSATVDGFRSPQVRSATNIGRIEELELYERVEILKGHSSILYGRGNPGGTVNYVTKKPQFERAHSLEGGFASRDDYYRGAFDTTGPIGQNIAYRLIGIYQDSRFHAPVIKDDRRIISPSFLWKPPGGGELFFNYEHSETNYHAFYNAVLINGEVVEYDVIDPRDDGEMLDADNLRLQFTQPLFGEWKLVLDGAYSDVDHLFQNIYFFPDSPINPTSSAGFRSRTPFAVEGYGGRAELQGVLTLGPTVHKLALGYERYHNDLDIVQMGGGPFGEGPPFDPQFGAPLPPPLDPPVRFSGDSDEQGVYFLDHVTLLDRLHLLGGLRYTEFESSDRITDVKEADESDLSPTLGGVFDVSNWLSVYASWGRSFEPNGGTDVNGNFFEPKRGEQYEVGLKGDAFSKRLNYTAAAFHLVQDNVTATDPNNPDFSALLGEVTIKGLELDLAAEITERLSALGALTWLDSKVDVVSEDFVGDRLGSTPDFSAALRLSYRFDYGLRFGASLIHVGDRLSGNFSEFDTDVDGYTRLDLDAGWRVPWLPGLTLFANLENVTDEDYVAGVYSPVQLTTGRPVTLYLRAQYAF